MTDIDRIANAILQKRQILASDRSLLVGISGIDGSGKGYLTKQIEARITQHCISTANINVDGWLNLPSTRFSTTEPDVHFYKNAIRFDELFTKLLLPLRDRKSIEVEVDFAEETANAFRKHTYSFRNVGIVLVEGIFLFKREYRELFDLTIWVNCSFFTALARALDRKQEGLTPAATIRAYETIYFPAQKIHNQIDHPSLSADLVVNNDPYLIPAYEKRLDFLKGVLTFDESGTTKSARHSYPSFH